MGLFEEVHVRRNSSDGEEVVMQRSGEGTHSTEEVGSAKALRQDRLVCWRNTPGMGVWGRRRRCRISGRGRQRGSRGFLRNLSLRVMDPLQGVTVSE